jgi:hypothetical protein
MPEIEPGDTVAWTIDMGSLFGTRRHTGVVEETGVSDYGRDDLIAIEGSPDGEYITPEAVERVVEKDD